MLKQLTSVQLSEWIAYDRLDPVGTWRDDLRIASLESLIVNITRALYPEKGKKPEFTSPDDFMIKWGEVKEEQKQELEKQSPEEMEKVLLRIARDQGTRDKIKKK